MNRTIEQELLWLRTQSKSDIRQSIYGKGSNPLKQLDQAVSEEIFGKRTPFRFCKEYLVSSTYEGIQRIARAYDVYRYGMEYNDSFKRKIYQLRSMTYDNLFSGDKPGDNYKNIIKGWIKENDHAFEEQLLLSFLLSIYVFLDERCRNRLISDYLKDFERSEANRNFNFYEADDDEEAMKALAKLIESNTDSSKFVIPEIPATKNTFSSTGRMKVFDQYELAVYCMNNTVMNKYVKSYLINCLKATQEYYGVDVSNTLSKVQRLEAVDGSEGIQFLPRLNFVPQSKGKIGRPVINGNDFSDIALYPFMNLLKGMMSRLPSNFSRSNRNSKSMYSKVEHLSSQIAKGVKIGNFTLKGSMSDIDSSNATERISGRYQWHLFRMLWNNLNEDYRLKSGITEDYLDLVELLLCETPFWYETADGIGISFTYGTCQGLMGSWDLLNLTMCCLLYLSWKDVLKSDSEYQHNWALKALRYSCHNGDDAGYEDTIDSTIKERLQGNSLEGVISADKSASESDIGYFAFSSAYVRTYKIPKLSNLRIISLLVAFGNPDEIHVYEEDRFMKQQLIMAKTLIDCFRSSYNILHMDFNCDNTYYQRARAFHRASQVSRFVIYKYLSGTDILSARDGADVALDEVLTPSIRCKSIIVYNKHISNTQKEILTDGTVLEQCFEIKQTLRNELLDEISDQRDEFIKTGSRPIFSEKYIQDIFDTYLGMERDANEYGFYSYSMDLSEYKSYKFNFQGYVGTDDQIVNVKLKFE